MSLGGNLRFAFQYHKLLIITCSWSIQIGRIVQRCWTWRWHDSESWFPHSSWESIKCYASLWIKFRCGLINEPIRGTYRYVCSNWCKRIATKTFEVETNLIPHVKNINKLLTWGMTRRAFLGTSERLVRHYRDLISTTLFSISFCILSSGREPHQTYHMRRSLVGP